MANLHDTLDPHETLSQSEAHEHHVHVTPFWPMLWVFVVLLVLTALTVWSSNIHDFWIGNTQIVLGPTEHILMALTIAVVKALLVAAYFMHLRYDNPMNSAIAGATIFAVILFLGFTLADMGARNIVDSGGHQKIIPGGNAHMNPDGTFNKTMGVVAAARANAKAAEGVHGDAGHGEATPAAPAAAPGAGTESKPATTEQKPAGGH
jgi:cytochrome c oxidase subunit 4